IRVHSKTRYAPPAKKAFFSSRPQEIRARTTTNVRIILRTTICRTLSALRLSTVTTSSRRSRISAQKRFTSRLPARRSSLLGSRTHSAKLRERRWRRRTFQALPLWSSHRTRTSNSTIFVNALFGRTTASIRLAERSLAAAASALQKPWETKYHLTQTPHE